MEEFQRLQNSRVFLKLCFIDGTIELTRIVRPTYNIILLLWRKFISDKSASGMLINPRIVFTFTRPRWSSNTFSSYLALLVLRYKIRNLPHPTSFISRQSYLFCLFSTVIYNLFVLPILDGEAGQRCGVPASRAGIRGARQPREYRRGHCRIDTFVERLLL